MSRRLEFSCLISQRCNYFFQVADTQKNANRVANSAVVNYDVSNTELPILSVEEAEERSSFFEVPPFFYPNQIGDLLKGMDEADQKIIASEVNVLNFCALHSFIEYYKLYNNSFFKFIY